MATKEPNYTTEMLETAKDMLADGATIEEVSVALNRNVRSVRAKLSREGIDFPRAEKPAAAKREDGPTKKELLAKLRGMVSFDVDGLAPATKETIAAVIAEFEARAESAVAEDMAEAA